MKKEILINYINEIFKDYSIKDESKNGLQVDTEKNEVKKIGYSVDTTTYIVDLAIKENVDIIIVHHGIFWGKEETLTGVNYERVKKLIKNDIGLYACHLPLDMHKEVGNNIGITKAFINSFSIENYNIEGFGLYSGNYVGYSLFFKAPINVSLLPIFIKKLNFENVFYNFGKIDFIRKIGVVSGYLPKEFLIEAKEKKLDLLITGELGHDDITLAKELGLSILLGGHRETEKIGIKLLTNEIKKKFKLETIFLDEKY